MNKKKSGFLIKFILIIVSIIFLTAISIFIYYKITREDESLYIPDDFLGYIKIDSLAYAYNNLIDLKSADVILSHPKLQAAYKYLLDLRKSKLAKNKMITSILNMKANVILIEDYSPIIIMDMGIKSMLLRPVQSGSGFIKKFINSKNNISLDIIKENSHLIHKLQIKDKNINLYFSINKNLLFFAFSMQDIKKLYTAKETGNNIKNSQDFNRIKNNIRKKSMANAYFNTVQILDPILVKIDKSGKIINKLDFDKNSTVSLNISNEEILLNIFTYYNSRDEKIKNFFQENTKQLEIINYLPLDTSLFTGLSIGSFEEFYKLFLYLQEGQYDNKIKKINTASKLLFQLSIEQLLFSWIGSEIGVFTSSASLYPIVFIKIKDKKQLELVISKIVDSLLVDEDKNIIVDGININKLKFPDFVQSILANFINQYIDAPYYKIIDDFVFFSMDPAGISNLAKKYQYKLTLNSDENFKKMTSQVDKDARLYIYSNIAQSTPDFIKEGSMIYEILRLYEKSILAIKIDKDQFKINLAANGENIKKTKIYPGYPKQLTGRIISPIVCFDLQGSKVNEILYIMDDNYIYISDINNNILSKCRIAGECYDAPIINDIDKDGQPEIYVFTQSGILHKFNNKLLESHPFPIETQFKGSFYPVIYKDKFIFYNKKDRKFYLMKNESTEVIDFGFDKPLLSQPVINKDNIIFYPKNVEGAIFNINVNGKEENGWPVYADGIGYGSPVLNNGKILFLTQSGKLNVFKMNGIQENNFPVNINGTFFNQPVVGDITGDADNEIAVLDKDGTVSIINFKGETIIQKKIKDADQKDRKFFLYDVNLDNKKEIIIYNGKNNILALDKKLNFLPGFPVKGYTKPGFSDFDSDGQLEMVTGGIDNFLYVYTIPR